MKASVGRSELTDLDARQPTRRLRAIPWADLSRLLDQQLWCWERDRQQGVASPLSASRSLGDGFVRVLVLHDGVWVRATGQSVWTVLLRRRPGPFMVETAAFEREGVVASDELLHPTSPADCAVALANVAALCRWIATVERRTLDERGPAHRGGNLRDLHPSRHYCAPGALAGCWRAWASLME